MSRCCDCGSTTDYGYTRVPEGDICRNCYTDRAGFCPRAWTKRGRDPNNATTPAREAYLKRLEVSK